MMRLQRIWAIGTNTVREAIRNKLLYSLLFFAITVIAFAVLIASLSYVESERIIQDVGFAAIRLFSLGIAVFVGIGLIYGEVERRTIYTILSKPVSRSDFLLGKWLGLVLTVWMQLALMGVAFAVVSLGAGAPLGTGHLAAFGMMGVELMLVVSIATLFSSFTTPMLAALFTIGLWIAGHLSRDMYALARHSDNPGFQTLSAWLYRLLPDLDSFNLTIQAVHGLPISGEEIGLPILYAIGYSVALLMMAAMVFRRRDLK